MTTTAKKPSTATELVSLAQLKYRLLQGPDGRPYAASLEQPTNAKNLSAVRDELAAAYYGVHGTAPGRNAVSEAMTVLAGLARATEREPVELRSVRKGNQVIIDPAWTDCRAILVGPGGVKVLPTANVNFRQTELTAPFPDAGMLEAANANLDLLREVVNVSDRDWPLLVAWMVATFLGIPVPVLFIISEQGAGKSFATRCIVSVIDPSSVPLRAAPKDLESWIVAAMGSQVVAVDNVSHISPWWSDALCRACTGEGLVKRALYTDNDLSVVTMRRSVILTTIDAGHIPGDLGERLLPVELERITGTQRRTEVDLAETLDEHLPSIVVGLLLLVGEVLAVIDDVEVDDLPRMADFARVLAAVDKVRGLDSLETYRQAQANVLSDLVAGDALAEAIVTIVKTSTTGRWVGTSSELLERLNTYRPHDSKAGWPRSPKGLSGALQRLAPALRASGVDVDKERTSTARRIVLREMARSVVTQ